MTKKIFFLIGMMGSGKSSVGKELAKRLQVKFIDIDDYVEQKQQKTIKDIFNDEGEEYFRTLESNAIAEVLKSLQEADRESAVIATGGGACIDKANRQLMSISGYVVFLETSIESLKQRLNLDTKRPLLINNSTFGALEDKIKKIFNERKDNYLFADVKVNTDQLGEQEVADQIINLYNEHVSSNANKIKVAIFDFDGTIYPFDTFMYLIDKLKIIPGYKSNYYNWMIKCLPDWLLYKLKLIDKSKMKRAALLNFIKSFHNNSEEEIERFFEAAYLEMRERYNYDVVKELKELQALGYVTLLISGAVEPFIKKFAKYLEIDHYAGSSLPMRNGNYDKNTNIKIVQANEKVKATHAIVDDLTNTTNTLVDWEGSYAYADSFSDLQVLSLVGNPVCIAPEKKLADVAKKNNWRIIS